MRLTEIRLNGQNIPPPLSASAADAELLARADGVFVVEGVALPVHQVLLRERCGLMKKLLNGSGGSGIPLVHHVAAGRALEVSCTLLGVLQPCSCPSSRHGWGRYLAGKGTCAMQYGRG